LVFAQSEKVRKSHQNGGKPALGGRKKTQKIQKSKKTAARKVGQRPTCPTGKSV